MRDVVELARRLPDVPVSIAGSGPLLADVLAGAAELGNLRALGFTAPEDIPALVERARLVVVPSLWQEPGALVPLEAMTLGTPVVAYANGGLAEYVADTGAAGSFPRMWTRSRRCVQNCWPTRRLGRPSPNEPSPASPSATRRSGTRSSSSRSTRPSLGPARSGAPRAARPWSVGGRGLTVLASGCSSAHARSAELLVGRGGHGRPRRHGGRRAAADDPGDRVDAAAVLPPRVGLGAGLRERRDRPALALGARGDRRGSALVRGGHDAPGATCGARRGRTRRRPSAARLVRRRHGRTPWSFLSRRRRSGGSDGWCDDPTKRAAAWALTAAALLATHYFAGLPRPGGARRAPRPPPAVPRCLARRGRGRRRGSGPRAAGPDSACRRLG